MFPCRAHLMWYCFQIQFLLVTMCHFISDFHRKDGKLFHYFKKLLLWCLVLPLERVNCRNVRTYLPWHINDLWTIFAKSCIKFLLPVLAQKPRIIGVNKIFVNLWWHDKNGNTNCSNTGWERNVIFNTNTERPQAHKVYQQHAPCSSVSFSQLRGQGFFQHSTQALKFISWKPQGNTQHLPLSAST